MGPTSVFSSSGSPTTSAAVAASSFSRNASRAGRWTSARWTEMQDCPAYENAPEAVAGGATALVGGKRVGDCLQPMILANTTPSMKVEGLEVFAPVVTLNAYEDFEEALRRVNDSKYGLGSTVFAGKSARSIASKLRAGMTSINSVMAFAGIPTLPFGGIGDSGFGRIHGDEGIREFTRVKSTAEQVMSIPLNMMSFRQPKDMSKRLRGMIKQLYGDGVVAKAGDLFRKLRS